MDLASLALEALAHCGAAIDARRGALASLALAGLLSGATHCAGMCGPFVLAQVGARLARLPAAMSLPQRLAGAAALPYQLGRATTYVTLGALAGGGFAWTLPHAVPVMAALLIALAVALLLQGLERLALPNLPIANWIRPLLDRPFGWRGYATGLALGLLPCAMIYAALAVAATSGDAVAGGLGMLVFALGTLPGSVAVGCLGHVVLARWRRPLRHLPTALLLANAAMLLLVATPLAL